MVGGELVPVVAGGGALFAIGIIAWFLTCAAIDDAAHSIPPDRLAVVPDLLARKIIRRLADLVVARNRIIVRRITVLLCPAALAEHLRHTVRCVILRPIEEVVAVAVVVVAVAGRDLVR